MILSIAEAKKVKGNVCNRTACDRKNAVCWHEDLFKYYCPKCARMINEYAGRTLVHFPIKEEILESE